MPQLTLVSAAALRKSTGTSGSFLTIPIQRRSIGHHKCPHIHANRRYMHLSLVHAVCTFFATLTVNHFTEMKYVF